MKRVVAFFDMFDEIPDNGKYLFSRLVEIPLEELEDQKAAKIISNNTEPMYIHYYELDHMDFEELMSTEFGKKTAEHKMAEFMKRYDILPK